MNKQKLKAEILYKAQLFDVPIFQNETLLKTLLDNKIQEPNLTRHSQSLHHLLGWLLKSQEEAQLSRS